MADKTCNTCKANKVCDHDKYGYETCGNYIPDTVVEVVRCKECSHRNPCGHKCLRDNLWHDDDDFCSYGERSVTEDVN